MAMIDREILLRNFTEQKAPLEDRIQLGIESHRKGYGRLAFVDVAGQPVHGVDVTIRQKTHDFKFGANLFKLGCFTDPVANKQYEEAFAGLFNYAIAPLYWDTFEPEEGKMRFAENSPFIDRRPPPESVLDFCRRHEIKVKGHPLFWALMLPKWLPQDYEAMKPYLTRRLQQIASRYDGVFDCFDCVNESVEVPLLKTEPNRQSGHYRNGIPLDDDYVAWTFRQADRFFLNSPLVLNETTATWIKFNQTLSPYYLQIENLLSKGCRIDKIGLQYHLFVTQEQLAQGIDTVFNPAHLYDVLDCYGQFGKPLQITEITVPGYGDNGDEIQAELLYNLYRIWFSQRDVEAIVYWNLGDNCAIVQEGWTEDQYKGGLLRNDFSAKPSYRVLQDLIHKEWQTNSQLNTQEAHLYFKGFYGRYEVTATRNGQSVTRDIHLSKKGFSTFTITLPV